MEELFIRAHRDIEGLCAVQMSLICRLHSSGVLSSDDLDDLLETAGKFEAILDSSGGKAKTSLAIRTATMVVDGLKKGTAGATDPSWLRGIIDGGKSDGDEPE